MNGDMIQALVRAVMNIVAGMLVAKGVGDASTWEQATGAVVTLAAVWWSFSHQKTMKATATAAGEASVPVVLKDK